jgi:hypothetical protein
MECYQAFHTPDEPVRIAVVAYEALKAGHTNLEVVQIVKERFPFAKTSARSVQWYRSRLRKEEPEAGVLTERQAKLAKLARP